MQYKYIILYFKIKTLNVIYINNIYRNELICLRLDG
jgi:hypothetical protein